MEEPVTLDSGEGTLEHSMHHMPQPPPRHESYMLKNADGSGSENYEHLPTRSLNSLNGPDDNNINFNLNENNEKYPHLYMLGEKDMGIDDTYMNDEDKDDKARLIHQGRQRHFINRFRMHSYHWIHIEIKMPDKKNTIHFSPLKTGSSILFFAHASLESVLILV